MCTQEGVELYLSAAPPSKPSFRLFVFMYPIDIDMIDSIKTCISGYLQVMSGTRLLNDQTCLENECI